MNPFQPTPPPDTDKPIVTFFEALLVSLCLVGILFTGAILIGAI